ncbi:MAG: hypothetical protein AAF387_06170 [Pseudomonadota bacterium]
MARLRLPERFLPLAGGEYQTPSGKCEFYSDSAAKKGRDPLPSFEQNNLDSNYPLKFLRQNLPIF